MSEYKITEISPEEPKLWKGPNGDLYYIDVMVEGRDKPVSVGKKSPDALKVGDVIEGEIEETDRQTDKFKHAKKAFVPGGSSKTPQDKEDIARAVALKAAVEHYRAIMPTEEDLFDIADSFLTWLKGSQKPQEAAQPSLKQKWAETQAKKQTSITEAADELFPGDEDAPR